MITCTSEMSGSASSGMLLMAQIPARTSATVPVKTRKRFSAHHSMIREIILHTSPGVYGELLTDNSVPILLGADCHLPRAPGAEGAAAFVQASAFVSTSNGGLHGAHAHSRHGRHIKGGGDLRSADRGSVVRGELHVKDVVAFMRRRRLTRQLHIYS